MTNFTEPVELSSLQPILQPLDIHLIASSILARNTPVEIYTDDPLRPTSAVARSGHRYLLAGAPDNRLFNDELRAWLAWVEIPRALEEKAWGIAFYFDSPGWQTRLLDILNGRRAVLAEREYYECITSPDNPHSILPSGFHLHQVNQSLLADTQINGLEALREEMCSERPSVADFIALSFGLVALHENNLAGWCLSEYNTGTRCEIGIAALQPYQRQGLATSMTHAFLDLARQYGIQRVGWHCFKHNLPSSATARKAGFLKICDYNSLILMLNQ